MKQIVTCFILLICSALPLAAQKVLSIKIDGSINPASAGFIHDAIETAGSRRAEALVIHLNTPGGLLKSTRVIVNDILASRVPVIVFVSPPGAHAGSAGVFITMAAHVAAMATGTNIGAAHPVDIQGRSDTVMSSKVTNDAVAFIRSLAMKRNRNAMWAEQAVRNSVSLPDQEALTSKVVDYVAADERQLLQIIDGRSVEVASGNVTMHTAKAHVETIEMSAVQKLLDMVCDPNIAYLLMMVGFFGIMFELFNPGAILPGIVGVISLIFAFYAMHTLPVNYAAVALIVFAIALFLLEVKIVSHGMLSIGGIISLLLGSVMLVHPAPGYDFARISWSVIIPSVMVTALFFLFIVGLGIKAQQRAVVTGVEGLIGEQGEVLFQLDPLGSIRLRGEEWKAESVSGQIAAGEKVRVKAVKGLTVLVEPMKNSFV